MNMGELEKNSIWSYACNGHQHHTFWWNAIARRLNHCREEGWLVVTFFVKVDSHVGRQQHIDGHQQAWIFFSATCIFVAHV